MFYLYTSNRTENLVDSLARMISDGSPPSLFVKELFLVQSRGMEVLLSQCLADYFQVWANSDYLLPMQFVSYLYRIIGTEPESDDYDREVLVWRIEKILRNTDDSELLPLDIYLKKEQRDLKRFQLARRLAHLFDQYQIMRPEFLEAWKNGVLATSEPSEKWQKNIWLKLYQQSAGCLHRGEVVQRLIGQLEEEQGLEEMLPERIIVFGLHTMPPLFLSVMNSLAKRIDVHFFLLSPCELYWGDIESEKVQTKRKLKELKSKTPVDLQPENSFHPLLTSLGRQGAHFQELLLDHIEHYQDGPSYFVNPLEAGRYSLLHRLQADIMDGTEATETVGEFDNAPDDSIMISSCHSRMRELNVLKDYILSWLFSDSSLELQDIIIMSPDIQDYSMMIPAVFGDIQYSISDRNKRKKNRYFDIFIQIIDLFSGRYGWSEMLGLLEKPEVLPRFGLSGSDLDKVRFWIIDSGIRWGLSASQRSKDSLVDIEAGSWKNGIERMLMGVAINSDFPIDNILPYTDIEGNDGEVLGGLYQFVDCVEKSRVTFSSDKTLKQWSEVLRSLCDDFFIDDEHPDLAALIQVLSRLEDDFSPYHDEAVTISVVKAWLEDGGKQTTSAGFLSGKLTFCSMLPMRSIPFKVICLLGLNDGQYPKNDVFTPFDLMGKQYQYGDRSSRADDRYQFLEAIIAARTRLYLSFIGQSIKTNDKIPPSVVVSELLETIDQFYGVGDIVVEHPLQQWNSGYFTQKDGLFSYDENSCQVARALNSTIADVSGWGDVEIVQEWGVSIDFNELYYFFRNPQSYFVKNILEVRGSFSEEMPEDSELFMLDGLQTYSTDMQILSSVFQGNDPSIILEGLQAAQEWPLGAPGILQFEERFEEIKSFADQVAGYDIGAPLTDLVVDIEFDGIIVNGLLTNCFEKGQLFYRYTKLKGKDLLQAWLLHLVAGKIRGTILPTCLMARDRTVVFGSETDGVMDMQSLFRIFIDGCKTPSKLFVEPALAYAEQVRKNRGTGRKIPIDVARVSFVYSMDQGYEPEWALLYRDRNPEDILDADFERICQELMIPLWDLANGTQEKS